MSVGRNSRVLTPRLDEENVSYRILQQGVEVHVLGGEVIIGAREGEHLWSCLSTLGA